jgi:hypothetical protein
MPSKIRNLLKGSTPVAGGFRVLDRDIIGYKQLTMNTKHGGRAIATLIIPKGTVVYQAANGTNDQMKCRAQKAYIFSITKISTTDGRDLQKINKAFSHYRTHEPVTNDKRFVKACDRSGHRMIYNTGEWIKPELPYSFVDDACESGIHFFLERERAVNY